MIYDIECSVVKTARRIISDEVVDVVIVTDDVSRLVSLTVLAVFSRESYQWLSGRIELVGDTRAGCIMCQPWERARDRPLCEARHRYRSITDFIRRFACFSCNQFEHYTGVASRPTCETIMNHKGMRCVLAHTACHGR